MTTTPDIPGLIASIARAETELRACQEQTSLARSAETRALNYLNRAQNALDAALNDLRKNAPRDSDWHRKTTRADDYASRGTE